LGLGDILRRFNITKSKSEATKGKNKIGYIVSNTVPIQNILNRTPLFVPLDRQSVNKASSEESPILYQDKHYKISTYGSRLSHNFDYPLLALIIKTWINEQFRIGTPPKTITIYLTEIDELFGFDSKQRKKENYKSIDASLKRLTSCSVAIETKNLKMTEYSPLLASAKFFYGSKPKKIEITLGCVLENLYPTLTRASAVDVSYINVDDIIAVPSEGAKALMKFFMTQRTDYIDFTLERLLIVLNHSIIKDPKIQKDGRTKIKKALDELVKFEYLSVYKPIKVRGWHEIRIIKASLVDDKEDGEAMLELLPSNFDKFKFKKKAKFKAPRPTVTTKKK